MSITLLECRESAAAKNNAFGDWQTVLNAPVELMPNDQVVLKTAVLDTTKATSGTITIESDVQATISGYPYVVNYQPTDKTYASGSSTDCDFKRYYAAVMHEGTNYKVLVNINIIKASYVTLKPWTITATFPGPPVTVKDTVVNEQPPGVSSGGELTVITPNTAPLATSKGVLYIQSTAAETATFTVTGKIMADQSNATEQIAGSTMVPGRPKFTTTTWYEITSIAISVATTAGTITVGTMSASVANKTANVSIPELKAGVQVMTVPCGIHVASFAEAKDVTFTGIPKVDGPTRKDPHLPAFTVSNVNIAQTSISDTFFEPLELSHVVDIPAGTYSTDALSTLINSSITRNKAESTAGTALLVNDMMKPSNYLGSSESLFMVRENDGIDPDLFSFNTNDVNGSWIGCSTIQLGIDANTNCYEWQYLHTPYYDSQNAAASTGSPAILYEQRGSNYFSTSAMMGVALTSLSPSTFWADQLGFGAGFATYTHGTTPRTVGTFAEVRFPTFNVAIGTSTTAQFVGTDSVVTKKATPNVVPALQQNSNAGNRNQLVDTANLDNFIPVTAPTAYNQLQKDSTGYFLIDVQSNFKTEVLGSTATSRTIQAIVGRFYNTGSYTISGSDSGVVYTHLGAPQMIQSMNIRVLHPDGTLADDIGNDSTLYFEIQRAASN